MKKLIAVVTLFAVACFAAWPNFTYDDAQTFESALASPWAETDTAGALTPQSTNAKYRGTYGLEVAAATEAYSLVEDTFSSGKSSVSFGFYFKSGAYASWVGDKSIAYVHSAGQGPLLAVRDGRSAGDNSRRISMSLTGSAITVSDNTWYWVTGKFVRNGTSSLAVYNTSGVQVGSTVTGTATDYAADSFQIAIYGAPSSTALYFDEVYVDYTSAAFPLGPPTEDATSARHRQLLVN